MVASVLGLEDGWLTIRICPPLPAISPSLVDDPASTEAQSVSPLSPILGIAGGKESYKDSTEASTGVGTAHAHRRK